MKIAIKGSVLSPQFKLLEKTEGAQEFYAIPAVSEVMLLSLVSDSGTMRKVHQSGLL